LDEFFSAPQLDRRSMLLLKSAELDSERVGKGGFAATS